MHTPHGKYSIKIEGPIVRTDAYSPFNLEGISVYFDDLEKRTAHLDFWVLHATNAEEVGITPDVLEFTKGKISNLSSMGCLGIVSQTPNKLLEHITKKVLVNTEMPQIISNDSEAIEAFINKLLAPHMGPY